MITFTVEETQPLELKCTSPLAEMYKLSPFVWRAGERYEVLIRAVNKSEIPTDKVSRIYHGESGDGLTFALSDTPVLAPGPEEEDRDGCEDPTVIVDRTTHVYYSGWNQKRNRGQLLLATGEDGEHLQKRGTAIPLSDQYQNPKEASLASCPDGAWRLFFEYANEGASKVGVASAPAVDGPWTIQGTPFEARRGQWDGWHLSPGPVLSGDREHPVMLYNGATKDVKWRIGWIMFDRNLTRIVDRCQEPIITPPAPGPDETDIAFIASSIEVDDMIHLYYSVADKDLVRTTVHRGSL